MNYKEQFQLQKVPLRHLNFLVSEGGLKRPFTVPNKGIFNFIQYLTATLFFWVNDLNSS
jgi:hypothetical protein